MGSMEKSMETSIKSSELEPRCYSKNREMEKYVDSDVSYSLNS